MNRRAGFLLLYNNDLAVRHLADPAVHLGGTVQSEELQGGGPSTWKRHKAAWVFGGTVISVTASTVP